MANPPATDPLMIDVPRVLHSDRLTLRLLEPGEGPIVYAAILESLDALRPWMPWAANPSPESTEAFVRRSYASFFARTELNYGIFDAGGTYVGNIGCHNIRWTVPRFELGYWCRSGQAGQGYVTEAASALSAACFALGARRVEIRMDPRNHRSVAVAERLGFTREGTLRHYSLDVEGQPRDIAIYARIA